MENLSHVKYFIYIFLANLHRNFIRWVLYPFYSKEKERIINDLPKATKLVHGKTKTINRNNKENYIMIRKATQKGDIIIMNLYEHIPQKN